MFVFMIYIRVSEIQPTEKDVQRKIFEIYRNVAEGICH